MLDLNLSGKTALIAGSTQGIGLASAQVLALQGATCVLIARNEEALKNAVASLDTSKGQQHSYLVADFSNPGQVKKAAEEFVSKNPIHILVNNTGGPPAGPVTDAKPEEFLNAFHQHLICNHLLATTVLPSIHISGRRACQKRYHRCDLFRPAETFSRYFFQHFLFRFILTCTCL